MTDMRIEYTSRGFPLVRFTDSLGRSCSLQESSLASESCIWFGRDVINEPEPKRMHLTQGMVVEILDELDAPGRELPMTFEDRYGSECIVQEEPSRDGTMHDIGIVVDFEGRPGERMTIDETLMAALRPMLDRFVEHGTIVP